eukprot:3865789-Pleurochrysis_carterae.AAC.1
MITYVSRAHYPEVHTLRYRSCNLKAIHPPFVTNSQKGTSHILATRECLCLHVGLVSFWLCKIIPKSYAFAPTTRAAHARTHEAAQPDRAAVASRASTPPKLGWHA